MKVKPKAEVYAKIIEQQIRSIEDATNSDIGGYLHDYIEWSKGYAMGILLVTEDIIGSSLANYYRDYINNHLK